MYVKRGMKKIIIAGITIQGQSGEVTFLAGTDVAISGLTISNNSTLSTTRSRGGCSQCIVSDDINTLVATKLTGTIESARLSGSYTGITTVGTLSEPVAGATTISSYLELAQITAPSTVTDRLYNVSGNLV